MTEQQEHLKNLLKQREDLALALERTRETLYKVTGAIEYLDTNWCHTSRT